MKIRYAVPWRPSEPRERLWAFCRSWWSECLPEARFTMGLHTDGPFNRSAAINRAAYGTWDILAIFDADVFASGVQVRQAIARVEQTGCIGYAFDRYVGLHPKTTEALLAGEAPDLEGQARFRSAEHCSSIVIVRRDLWERIGPFDEAYTGWGLEDVAFAHKAGPEVRAAGAVYHLWHPPSPHKHRGKLYRENRQRFAAQVNG